MNINSTMLAPPPTFTPQPIKKSNEQDLKGQFMTLLTEQIKNQDPTDPLKPQEQIAQLAQLSSLEQSQSQTATLKSILDAMPSSKNQAVPTINLIGHKINFKLSEFMIQNSAQIKYKLNPQTIVDDSDVTVALKDPNGHTIQEFNVTKNNFNDSLEWDGKDKNGAYVGYKPIRIFATQQTKSGLKEVQLTSTSNVKSFNFHSPNVIKLENDITINSSAITDVY
ncbi:flagellar hook assembly protein FlgD [Photobacterium damselae]|uniref:flagellar hook assembly protein FlgD n=1 Tax=Photobacterium damselae TaxID=38293 RepID=UPI001F38634E|nr:flagellar hook capping FlgD N-terminal domain-containing protein [Photobacterium damselae]UKA04625.1 hypothetical protein IHC89_23690 [Photobacterium damselae subsp. damselae]